MKATSLHGLGLIRYLLLLIIAIPAGTFSTAGQGLITFEPVYNNRKEPATYPLYWTVDAADQLFAVPLPGLSLIDSNGLAVISFTNILFRAWFRTPERWESRSTGPGPRLFHSAVWTGTEMLIWGGGADDQFLNDGGRYDPMRETWRPISTVNAPSGRWAHAAVWTGTEMIVWGGRDHFAPQGNKNDGARYNPATDTWTPISTEGAPSPRSQCAAVWTGSEMIIWGGWGDNDTFDPQGARYDPVADRWTPLPLEGAPEPRMEPAAVWTGSEMIVWGGDTDNPWRTYETGARFNPTENRWTPVSTLGAPVSSRGGSAVWTGSEMIVWGGGHLAEAGTINTMLNTGARYSPLSDTWTPMSTLNAPSPRFYHSSAWTGSELIVWGGQDQATLGHFQSGGRYNPLTDRWEPTTLANAPAARFGASAVWTGQGVLLFGGYDLRDESDANDYYVPGDYPSPTTGGGLSILTQPMGGQVRVGSSFRCYVRATGDADLTYQWLFNGQPIPGATNAFLYLDNVQPDQEGDYAVEISGGTDSLVSAPAHLTVLPADLEPPAIIAMSGDQTVEAGSPVRLSVQAEGTAPLNYQWLLEGRSLAGQTDATLSIDAARPEDAGVYQVRVSNVAGAVYSPPATLVVLARREAPIIASQPLQIITTRLGSDLTLEVTVEGAAPLSYQWYFNGAVLAGATDASLTLANLQPEQGGTYSLVASNSFGTATSRGTLVNVDPGLPGGTVVFGNSAGSLVTLADGVTPVPAGAAFLAQLYAGPAESELEPVGSPVSFILPGRFLGGIRTIPTVVPGQQAWVQVRVWASDAGRTFAEAAAAGGQTGTSASFLMPTGGGIVPPSSLTFGLESFTLTPGLVLASMTHAAATSLHAFSPPAPSLKSSRRGDGKLEWHLAGQAGVHYVIEASTNLRDWEVLTELVCPPDGIGQIVDPRTRLPSSCFYRARLAGN